MHLWQQIVKAWLSLIEPLQRKVRMVHLLEPDGPKVRTTGETTSYRGEIYERLDIEGTKFELSPVAGLNTPELINLTHEDELPDVGQVAKVYALSPKNLGNPVIFLNPANIADELIDAEIGSEWTVKIMEMDKRDLERLRDHDGW